jgi:hypothetical protein
MVYRIIRFELAARKLGKLDRTVTRCILDRVQGMGATPFVRPIG